MGQRAIVLLAVTCFAATSPRAGEPADLSQRLAAAAPGLRPAVLRAALDAHGCAAARGEVEGSVLAVVDFELPATGPRLWLFDLRDGRLLLQDSVAQGHGRFSNAPRSHATSVGLYRSLDAYQGKHGHSRRLRGLEAGFNDRAEARAIVVHGAAYVSATRAGRSWGCLAVPLASHRQLVDALVEGSAVFVWGDEPAWRASSPYLHCGSPSRGQ